MDAHGRGRFGGRSAQAVPHSFRQENGRRPPQNGRKVQPVIRTDDKSYKFLAETKVKITNLDKPDAPAVYHFLSQFGNIHFIDIIRSSNGWSAFVVFRPPPQEAVWERFSHVHKIDPVPRPVRSPIRPDISYPECTLLYAHAVDFGTMIKQTTMMRMHTALATKARVQVFLNLRRKEIEVIFPLHLQLSPTAKPVSARHRFRLPIAQLQQIYEVPGTHEAHRALIIPFGSAPEFYKWADNVLETFAPGDRRWSEHQAWYRQTDIVDKHTKDQLETQPVAWNNEGAVIDIGRWTTYRLVFDQSTMMGKHYYGFRSALIDHNVQFIQADNIEIVEKIKAPVWDLLHEETAFSKRKTSTAPASFDDLFTSDVMLDFAVRYQLEVCLSNGWIHESNIDKTFLQKLATMDIEEARYILEKVADRQTRYYNPMGIFNIRVKENIAKKVPSYCVLTRAANVTPAMIHVATPVVETSNRIVRAYKQYEDRFLRVKFTDEKTIGRINSQDNNNAEAIFERICRAMKEGIVVAGRFYRFLAFGNSQFREHGAYFFAPCSTVDVDDIRQGMGTFDHIRTAAKFGARIGQCFSTTRPIHSTKVEIIEIPDIERNGLCFTDGVGKLSTFLAQMSAQELGLQNPFDDCPSLFQFRLGGCKGVLALDPKLKRQEVHIRPSQYKFPAVQKGLEIIRSSAFATACFNRQLVIVLSSLGVPDEVFLRKQQEMVNDLNLAMEVETVALHKLQRNIDLNQSTLVLAKMILDGFMHTREPFTMSLLQLWRAYTIKFLKEKARIVIEKGAFLLGCVDETGHLRGHYDDPQSRPDSTRQEKLDTLPQIFIQISDPDKRGHYKIIEGLCILARNPSLHGGDLRIVRAVDIPALHHLKNVVVLPQTGDRDIANMCSGGDLDGDDYLVMWDMDFLPQIINEPPMDYTPEKPKDLDRPVTIDDVIDFFVTYMKNDSLARIALAHLAQADFNEGGVRDETCLRLAELHSQAVDYPKSGIPAIMDRDLRPKKYPHFMESKYRSPDKIYHSKKVLGKLFDQVKLVDFKPMYESAFDSRILDAFELDDALVRKAKEVKESYDNAVRRIMAKHAIKTEFEVWSAFVLEHNQESRDYTFPEELGRIMGTVKEQYQSTCCEAAGAGSPSDYTQMAPFIVAMYTVTAREMEEALQECHKTKLVGGKEVPVRKMVPEEMPLMSFPWLFGNELGKIATGNIFDHQLVKAQQGVAKKRKHLTELVNLDPEVGQVETKAGVTQRGEILKLFEDLNLDDQAFPIINNEKDQAHIEMVEKNVHDPYLVATVRPTNIRKDRPTVFDDYLSKAKEMFELDQAEQQAAQLDGLGNVETSALSPGDVTSTWGAATPWGHEEEGGEKKEEAEAEEEVGRREASEDEETVIINMGGKKSAWDELAELMAI